MHRNQPTDVARLHSEAGRTTAEQAAQALPPAQTPAPTDFPVYTVREWASRYYAQERLAHEATWWRLGWPFLAGLLLGGAAAVVAWRWPVRGNDLALGAAVVIGAVAVGTLFGGAVRLRRIRVRRAGQARRPATLESLPATARDAVLATPRLRFRWPADQPSFRAACDGVARLAPMGEFTASVLVWALTMRDRVDGSLDDWLRGRAG